MTERHDTEALFKALADTSRRKLLDLLHVHDGRTLSELCEHLDMTRQGVTQHLDLLVAANLVATVRRGREKLHFLNPVPLQEIYERWIAKFEKPHHAGEVVVSSDRRRGVHEAVLVRCSLRKPVDGGILLEDVPSRRPNPRRRGDRRSRAAQAVGHPLAASGQ